MSSCSAELRASSRCKGWSESLARGYNCYGLSLERNRSTCQLHTKNQRIKPGTFLLWGKSVNHSANMHATLRFGVKRETWDRCTCGVIQPECSSMWQMCWKCDNWTLTIETQVMQTFLNKIHLNLLTTAEKSTSFSGTGSLKSHNNLFHTQTGLWEFPTKLMKKSAKQRGMLFDTLRRSHCF